MSAPHRVAEVERPGALDHDGVLEHDVVADELTEVADARAEQDRHLADAELVDEAEVQGLLDDVGAGDRHELAAAARPRCRRSSTDLDPPDRTSAPAHAAAPTAPPTTS